MWITVMVKRLSVVLLTGVWLLGFSAAAVVAAEDDGIHIEFPLAGPEDECVVKHVLLYDEPGRYTGRPANGGFGIWGDDMAVAFECGWFKDKPDWEDGHARDTKRSNEDIVARSSDGGLTWTHKKYDIMSSDNGKTWGKAIILRTGARNWDFGYSRSLQRHDDKVITVYYWATPKHRNQYLTGTIWDPSKVKLSNTNSRQGDLL